MKKIFPLVPVLFTGLIFTSCIGAMDFSLLENTLSVYNDTQAGLMEIDGRAVKSFPFEFDPFPVSCSLKANADTARGYTFLCYKTEYEYLFGSSSYRDFAENPKTFDFENSISKDDVNRIRAVYSRFSLSSTAVTGKSDPVLCSLVTPAGTDSTNKGVRLITINEDGGFNFFGTDVSSYMSRFTPVSDGYIGEIGDNNVYLLRNAAPETAQRILCDAEVETIGLCIGIPFCGDKLLVQTWGENAGSTGNYSKTYSVYEYATKTKTDIVTIKDYNGGSFSYDPKQLSWFLDEKFNLYKRTDAGWNMATSLLNRSGADRTGEVYPSPDGSKILLSMGSMDNVFPCLVVWTYWLYRVDDDTLVKLDGLPDLFTGEYLKTVVWNSECTSVFCEGYAARRSTNAVCEIELPAPGSQTVMVSPMFDNKYICPLGSGGGYFFYLDYHGEYNTFEELYRYSLADGTRECITPIVWKGSE